jgi:hypothetical protein
MVSLTALEPELYRVTLACRIRYLANIVVLSTLYEVMVVPGDAVADKDTPLAVVHITEKIL